MSVLDNSKAGVRPHIHVPYSKLKDYLSFIRQERLDLEIYFGSRGFDDLTISDIEDLKRLLDYGPDITVHSPFMDLSPGAVDPKVRDITIKRFSDLLTLTEILKPRAAVFHSGYYRWKYDNRVDIWLEGSLITWRSLSKRAEDMGVKIVIENIFEDEPSNLKLLMEEIDSDNFGICFDTGHFNIFSKISLMEWLSVIKPYIIELHLHDNDKTADSHLAIGDGNFDFDTLFTELRGRDYIYTIEAHTIEDAKKSMERLESYLRV